MSRKMTLHRRALFAGACALTLVACGRTVPQAPPTGSSPTPVTVPVGVGPGGNLTAPSDLPSSSASDPVTPSQVALPAISTPFDVSGPTQIAFTSDLDFRGISLSYFTPFSLTGIQGLFVYDDASKDNYAIPGAGVGIENPQIFDGGTKVVFDRVDGTIWFYDLLTELTVQFNDVNGTGYYVTRPSITQDGTVMTYVGVPGWVWPSGVAFIWINGVVAELSKVNAVGMLHGGISWIRISANGRWAVFTTGDGALFTYDVVNTTVYQVTDARVVASGYATDPDISPDGSQIVWSAIEPDGSMRIYRYDRVAGLVDPMPFANLAMGASSAFDPRFLGPDGSWITYEVFTAANWGGFRVLGYDWITEAVRTFSILNSVQGEGDQRVSN